MIVSPILEAKYKVQKQLDEEAQHDILEYAKNSHRIVTETEAIYRVKFKYGSATAISSRRSLPLSTSQELA